jgi:hypothetical protein
MKRVSEITAARVIQWSTGEVYGVAFTLGHRRVAVPIGQKHEAEAIAQSAIGKGDALIRDLEGKAEARFT